MDFIIKVKSISEIGTTSAVTGRHSAFGNAGEEEGV
jgi:hypothetical protein